MKITQHNHEIIYIENAWFCDKCNAELFNIKQVGA
jgi:hypothetical protein